MLFGISSGIKCTISGIIDPVSVTLYSAFGFELLFRLYSKSGINEIISFGLTRSVLRLYRIHSGKFVDQDLRIIYPLPGKRIESKLFVE